MVAGADSINDLPLLRHGGMGQVFSNAYAPPSTLGSFLRAFSFGHVRQLDAVASRFLTRLAEQTPLVATASHADGQDAVYRLFAFEGEASLAGRCHAALLAATCRMIRRS